MTFNELNILLNREGIFQDFGLERLGVFGSFVRNEEYNDIDFLLEQYLSYKKREELKQRLEKILKKSVDLVSAQFADPIIVYRAKKELKYATRAMQ